MADNEEIKKPTDEKAKADKSKEALKLDFSNVVSELPVISRYLHEYANSFDKINKLSENWGSILKANLAVMTSFVRPTGVLSLLITGIGKVLSIQNEVNATMREYRGMVANLAENFGAFGEQWTNVLNLMKSNMGVFNMLYNNMAGASEFAVSMVNSFSRLKKVDIERYGKLVLYLSKAMGLGNVEAAKLVYNMEVAGMKSVEMFTYFNDLINVNTKNLKKMGIPVNLLIKSMASNINLFLRFGKEGKEAFLANVIWAKQLNVELSKIIQVSDTFEDLESGLKTVAKLSVYFGTNMLSGIDLLLTTDPAKRIEKIRDAVLATGKSFNEMSYYEKKALTTTLNLSEEDAARIFNLKEGYKSVSEIMDEINKAKIKDIQFEKNSKKLMYEITVKLNKALKETATVFRDLGPYLKELWFAAERAFGPLYESLFGVKTGLIRGLTVFLNDLSRNDEWRKFLIAIANGIKMVGGFIKDIIISVSNFVSKNQWVISHGLIGAFLYGSLGLMPVKLALRGFGAIFKLLRLKPPWAAGPTTTGLAGAAEAAGATGVAGTLGAGAFKKRLLVGGVTTMAGVAAGSVASSALGVKGDVVSSLVGGVAGQVVIGRTIGVVAGRLIGTTLGTALGGPVGAVIGNVIGGAVGTVAANVISDFVSGDRGFGRIINAEKEKFLARQRELNDRISDISKSVEFNRKYISHIKEQHKLALDIKKEELDISKKIIENELQRVRTGGQLSDLGRRQIIELIESSKSSEKYRHVLDALKGGTEGANINFNTLKSVVEKMIIEKEKEIKRIEESEVIRKIENEAKMQEMSIKLANMKKEFITKKIEMDEERRKKLEAVEKRIEKGDYISKMGLQRYKAVIGELSPGAAASLFYNFFNEFKEIPDIQNRIVKELNDLGMTGAVNKKNIENFIEANKDKVSNILQIMKNVTWSTSNEIKKLGDGIIAGQDSLVSLSKQEHDMTKKLVEITEMGIAIQRLVEVGKGKEAMAILAEYSKQSYAGNLDMTRILEMIYAAVKKSADGINTVASSVG